MQCSFPFSCWWSLLLLATAASAACPLIGAGADPPTKAYLAPVVFHGRLIALTRRGPVQQANFRVDKVFKGSLDSPSALVEFATRKNPARCRGAPYREGELQLEQRYVVFAAWRRPRKMIAVAQPEAYSKRKAVAKVLCTNCAKAPSIKGLKDTTVDLQAKLRLKCRISGNPPPRVAWFKNGLRLRADGRIKVRSKRKYSNLIISRVGSKDGGEYECLAVNVIGNSTASAKVVVATTATDSTLWPFKIGPCPRRNFCLNGGMCSYYEVVREYVCECAEGYRGQRCESKAISTLSSPSPVDAPKAPHDLDATTRMLQHYWGK